MLRNVQRMIWWQDVAELSTQTTNTISLCTFNPLRFIYLGEVHKWKNANGPQQVPAVHPSLDITCHKSHTSSVWTGWKWCSSNEPASPLNVFTLHTPLWWRWCERLQVSSGHEGCQRRRGSPADLGVGERNGNRATAHWEHQPVMGRTGNMSH